MLSRRPQSGDAVAPALCYFCLPSAFASRLRIAPGRGGAAQAKACRPSHRALSAKRLDAGAWIWSGL